MTEQPWIQGAATAPPAGAVAAVVAFAGTATHPAGMKWQHDPPACSGSSTGHATAGGTLGKSVPLAGVSAGQSTVTGYGRAYPLSGGSTGRAAVTGDLADSPGVVTVAASTIFSGSFGAPLVIDGDPTTYWASSAAPPQWLYLQFSHAAISTSYALLAHVGEENSSPTAWTYEGSNDGVTWTVLDTRSGQSLSGTVVNLFHCTNTTAYSYYRLNMSATSGGGGGIIRLAEFWAGLHNAPFNPKYAYPAASSSFSGGYLPANVLDSSIYTFWCSSGGPPAWISLIPSGSLDACKVTSYTITPHPTEESGAPYSFTLEGSNDNLAWTVLDTRTGITWPTDVPQTFTVTGQTVGYSFYRVNTSAVGAGGSQVRIASLSMATAPALSTDILAGTAVGSGTATGALHLSRALAGTAAGRGTAAGYTAGSHPLAGATAGHGTAAGLLGELHGLTGLAAGHGSTTGGLRAGGLYGTAAGHGGASGSLHTAHPLAGASAGQGTGSGLLGRLYALSGTAAATAADQGALVLLLALLGDAAGAATAAGDLEISTTGVQYCSGLSAGQGGGSGALNVAAVLPDTIIQAVAVLAAGLVTVPDLSENNPIDMGLLLHGDLLVRLPTPAPDLFGELNMRTQAGMVLTLPTPTLIEGRPSLPAYPAVNDSSSVGTEGPHHIHAIADPDPVWDPNTSGWFQPPGFSGVGDARWTVQTLPDPGGYPGSYYWLGDPSVLDGTRGIENGAAGWAPDLSTPGAPTWRSFFPFKPSVRALDTFLPGGNVVHHPKGVHFNSQFIEHMWLDFGGNQAQPFSFVIAAMIASFPAPNFVHHLLDAGRNPDDVGFPRISDTDCGQPRNIADGLGYRSSIAASGAVLSLQASAPRSRTVVSRFDANVRPKMFFGIFNGATSQVGAYDPGARRVKSGAIDHGGAQLHRFFVMGRKQGRIAQGDSCHMMVFEIRYWRRALAAADLDDQYGQLSSTYQFNAYRGV